MLIEREEQAPHQILFVAHADGAAHQAREAAPPLVVQALHVLDLSALMLEGDGPLRPA